MRVIFLDFDGVIDNWDSPNGVNAHVLKRIIDLTGAIVVETTSNKYSFQREKAVGYSETRFYKYIKELQKFGVEVHDITPYVGGVKENEIIEYLKNHPEVDEFLILDDELVSKILRDHQVLPDLYNGLMEEHIEPSINILNGNLNFYPPGINFEITPEEWLIRINEHHTKKQ
jgi:hypothetical protein